METIEVPMARRNTLLLDGNRLKLALFGSNCSCGRAYADVPERWDASWEHNLALARMADELGIEAVIPIARWKGHGGSTNPNGWSFESVAWACGLLAATRRVNAFCTIHVPLNHPVAAARQMATADHVGQGRLGLNIVCGWNEDEFRMFGLSPLEHEARYDQGEEWWSIVQRIWAGEGPFDFEGAYYRLYGVEGAPGPYGGQTPLVMNAGSSPTGRAFAIRHSDLHFDGVRQPQESRQRIAETKRLARERGREIQVWTPLAVVCRPSRREADDYVRYLVDHADWEAIGRLGQLHASDARDRSDPEGVWRRTGAVPVEWKVVGRGAYCAIGDPDGVAGAFARLRGVGFDGLAVSFVDYLAELPYFAQEVLPRLERLGLRSRALPPAEPRCG